MVLRNAHAHVPKGAMSAQVIQTTAERFSSTLTPGRWRNVSRALRAVARLRKGARVNKPQSRPPVKRLHAGKLLGQLALGDRHSRGLPSPDRHRADGAGSDRAGRRGERALDL